MELLQSINHKISTSQLQPGDHIYCYRRRSGYTYAHHGIYIGGDQVVHFLDNSDNASEDGEPEATTSSFPVSITKVFSSVSGRNPGRCERCISSRRGGVQMVCMTCFLKGDTLRLFYYGVSKAQFVMNIRGGCSGIKSEDAAQVIERTCSLLESNAFGEYNLHTHNCEDFAIYCKTGVIDTKSGMSKQVELFRQLGKSVHEQEGTKFSAVNLFKSMKINMIDERWDRDVSNGKYMSVDELAQIVLFDPGKH